MEEELILNEERFYNLLNMINSKDDENVTLAISTLQRLNINLNRIYILFIMKEANFKDDDIKIHLPSINDFLTKNHFSKIITYKEIFKYLNNPLNNVKDEEKVFYIKYLAKHLKESVHALGYDFIDDLVIKINDGKK